MPIQDTDPGPSSDNTKNNSSFRLWTDLRLAIKSLDLDKFKLYTNQHANFSKIATLKPRLINETLQDCISQAVTTATSSSVCDGCDFIEVLMTKLHQSQCYFASSDEICKSIVQLYVSQRRQFSPFTLCFLLRCYDLKLLQAVFEHNLVDSLCFGSCHNWHIMFVASYQERFFSASNESVFEGFVCRFILLSKLNCSPEQKRSFLTWFAGSLHLYADEFLLKNEEDCFKHVLAMLFEGLILNGLLSNSEFKNFHRMLIKRNEEMITVLNNSYYNSNTSGSDEADPSGGTTALASQATFPNLSQLFPLSLKNICRLAVKRKMTHYTRTNVESLPLPNNLKKFIYFDSECEFLFKNSGLLCKQKLG